jgi:hypothetical protein
MLCLDIGCDPGRLLRASCYGCNFIRFIGASSAT